MSMAETLVKPEFWLQAVEVCVVVGVVAYLVIFSLVKLINKRAADRNRQYAKELVTAQSKKRRKNKLKRKK